MTDHAPLDMRNDNTRTNLLRRRALQLHAAGTEDRLVEEGVVPLNFLTPPPPPAADIDKIRVLSEARGEAAHIVRVPSPLDLTHKRRDRLVIHGPRSYSRITSPNSSLAGCLRSLSSATATSRSTHRPSTGRPAARRPSVSSSATGVYADSRSQCERSSPSSSATGCSTPASLPSTSATVKASR
jgi:hypothetical protein